MIEERRTNDTRRYCASAAGEPADRPADIRAAERSRAMAGRRASPGLSRRAMGGWPADTGRDRADDRAGAGRENDCPHLADARHDPLRGGGRRALDARTARA